MADTEPVSRQRGASPAAPHSKAEDLAHKLRAEIASRRLAPGAMLDSEAELLQRYAVSRPTYREAIRMLESEGLVEVRRGVGGGTRVLQPTLEPLVRNVAVILQARDIKVESLFAARLLYEPEIAAEIAKHRDQQVLSRLAEIAAAQEFTVGDRPRFNECDRAFRRVLVESSRNPVVQLIALLIDDVFNRHIANVSHRLPRLPVEAAHQREGVNAKHALLRALADGDGKTARRIWRIYVAQYSRRVTTALGTHETIVAYGEEQT